MRRIRVWAIVMLAAAALSLPGGRAAAQDQGPTAHQYNRMLGRGVNLGNALEAPSEGQWGMRIERPYLKLIREAGFDSVRFPIRWSAHAQEEAPYRIDASFMRRVDEVVDWALDEGLVAMVNMHHYNPLYEDPAGHRQRFRAIWEQIARHMRDRPQEVCFELLNEPHAQLTPERWNELFAETLAVVRRSNPRRIVIVGPGNWNNVNALPTLKLPEDDRRLIATFHYYLPFQFTHQGAGWAEGSDRWLGTTWTATAEQRRAVEEHFDAAARWAEREDRPLYVGEFGAYERAPMDSRIEWTAFVREQAERRGFSWAYWEFGAGFGIYDREARRWREGLLEARVPDSHQPAGR